MKQYPFEKLDVWNRSREFVKMIYLVTDGFPAGERYGLTQQMRRAVISVASNIAEGSARKSLKDQSRFSVMAYGSLMEILNQLIIAKDLGYIEEAGYITSRKMIEELSNKLNSLNNSQQNRYKSTQNTQTPQHLNTSTNKHLNK